MSAAAASDQVPLCVDLDGTLIAGDTLVISLRELARRRPWKLPEVAIALARGRGEMKTAVAAYVVPNPSQLPWRAAVVDFVRAQHAQGRRVLLATAAHRRIAEAVASYLTCFDGIVATDGSDNAKGAAKVAAIRRAIGAGPFDYVGDSIADLPIFAAARHGYLVAPSPELHRQAAQAGTIVKVFDA
ncbi:MAG: haloacid dehalogenase-like hydrolase [Gemmatimonadaceae bacterium]